MVKVQLELNTKVADKRYSLLFFKVLSTPIGSDGNMTC